MIRLLRATALALVFAVAFDQPTAPKSPIIVGKVDATQAAVNRKAIEDGLRGGATFKLPAGEILLDAALSLGPQHAGSTLVGTGPMTILRNAYATANGVNGTLAISGLGVPYLASATVSEEADAYVLDVTIPGTPLPWDSPGAQTNLLKAGNVCYAFAYDSYMTQSPPPRRRYVIRWFDPTTRRLTLDGMPDPKLLSLKWMDGSAIADVREGDRVVRLVNPANASTFAPGRFVFVTSGPSLANGSVGEHRRVLSADVTTGIVTLDAAVTRAYTMAALVRVSPVAGLTIKNLCVAQPVEPTALCQLDATCDTVFDRVTFYTPQDEARAVVGLNSCGRVQFKDCTLSGGLQVNASHDTVLDGGTVCTLIGEEGSTHTTVRNAIIRLDPRRAGVGLNGVTFSTGADRLTLTKTRIEGFGGLITGGGGARQCPAIISGKGLVLRDVSMTGNQAVGSYLSSDAGQIVRVTSDGGLHLVGGIKWKVQDSSAPGWELRQHTGGVMSGCSPAMTPPTGWVIKP